MKRNFGVIFLVIFFTGLLIFFSVKSGFKKGDITIRFQERQMVTFISALLLGATSLCSLMIYRIRRRLGKQWRNNLFWALASLGFFYLCMDDYFMAHEGLDTAVASLFGRGSQPLELDGLTIGFFGMVAFAVCAFFRRTLLENKRFLGFLIAGGVCLAGTVIFDLLQWTFDKSVMIVVEESFKIFGVAFFFTGFLLTMFSTIENINVISKPKNKKDAPLQEGYFANPVQL